MEPKNNKAAGKSGTKKRGKTLYDRLPAKNKNPTLEAHYLSLPAGLTEKELRAAMIEHFGCTGQQLSEMSHKNGWKGKRESRLALQLQQDDLARVLAENETIRENIPSSQLARQIKDFVWYGTTVAARHLHHNGQMHRYYIDLITRKVVEVGGWQHVDDYTRKEIALLQKRVDQHFNALKDFLRPQALAALLHTINFTDTIPKEIDGVDQEAYTIASLQKFYTEKMGALGLLQNEQAALRIFQQYETEEQLPDIEGTR